MERKITTLQTRLHLIAAVILIVGLSSAILIYLTAEKDSVSVLGYEVSGGNAYPIMPEDSKKFQHDLELYGGKASVIVNEFMRWFAGLWHGKSLAFTVGCITIFTSFCLFFVGNNLSSDLKSDAGNRNNQDGNG